MGGGGGGSQRLLSLKPTKMRWREYKKGELAIQLDKMKLRSSYPYYVFATKEYTKNGLGLTGV